MGAETGHFRGENGLIQEMDLPLSDAFAGRLKRGEVVRVHADGSTWTDDPSVPPTVTADELSTNTAELHKALSEALTHNDELVAELDLATRQRDALAAELAKVKSTLEQPPDEVSGKPMPVKATKATK